MKHRNTKYKSNDLFGTSFISKKSTTTKTATLNANKVNYENKQHNAQTPSKQAVTRNTTDIINTKWNRSIDITPEEDRPIIFNTDSKSLVVGIKIYGGYVVNTPYTISRFEKANGYFEWNYNPYCKTLMHCPNKFPDCENCKYYSDFKKG
jgi:hypothetical protein